MAKRPGKKRTWPKKPRKRMTIKDLKDMTPREHRHVLLFLEREQARNEKEAKRKKTRRVRKWKRKPSR